MATGKYFSAGGLLGPCLRRFWRSVSEQSWRATETIRSHAPYAHDENPVGRHAAEFLQATTNHHYRLPVTITHFRNETKIKNPATKRRRQQQRRRAVVVSVTSARPIVNTLFAWNTLSPSSRSFGRSVGPGGGSFRKKQYRHERIMFECSRSLPSNIKTLFEVI